MGTGDTTLFGKEKIVRQFSFDILDDGDIDEEKLTNILAAHGIDVLGAAWKATWTEEGYHKSEPPISSD